MANNFTEQDVLPSVIVDPRDTLATSTDENQQIAGAVLIIGNFPTTNKDIVSFDYTQVKKAKDWAVFLPEGVTVKTTTTPNAQFLTQVEEGTKIQPGALSEVLDKMFVRQEVIDPITKNKTVTSKGAQSVILYNTSVLDTDNNQVVPVPLIDTVLIQAFDDLAEENADLLLIGRTLDNGKRLDDGAPIYGPIPDTVVITDYIKQQYMRKNPISLMAAFDLGDETETTGLRNIENTDSGNCSGYTHNPSVVSVCDYVQAIQAFGEGNQIIGAFAQRMINGSVDDNDYKRLEVAAIMTNFYAGRNVDLSLVQFRASFFTDVDPRDTVAFSLPSYNTEGQIEKPPSLGFKLSYAGFEMMKLYSRLDKHVIVVNSLVPRYIGAPDDYYQFDISAIRIRNYVINALDLQIFLGKKRSLPTIDALTQQIADKLSKLEAIDLLLRSDFDVRLDPKNSKGLIVDLTLWIADVIAEIIVYVTLNVE